MKPQTDVEYDVSDLQKRVERIEARQRANNVHDPECAYLRSVQAQDPMYDIFFKPPSCNCWLSEDLDTQS